MMITQKVSIKLSNATIQTNGPLWEPAEWLGTKYISPEVTDTVMIPFGTPYECTVDEACGLLRRWSGEVVSENPPQNSLDAIAAYDAEQAAKYPAC